MLLGRKASRFLSQNGGVVQSGGMLQNGTMNQLSRKEQCTNSLMKIIQSSAINDRRFKASF